LQFNRFGHPERPRGRRCRTSTGNYPAFGTGALGVAGDGMDGCRRVNNYTNGRHGAEWSVRQIIDEAPHPGPARDMVIYKVVEGKGLRSTDSCTREDFSRWAMREVFPAQENGPPWGPRYYDINPKPVMA